MASPLPLKSAAPTAAPALDRPYVDPVIEAYKKDVDRTLIREMLKLTPEQRILALEKALEEAVEMRAAMANVVARGGK